MQDKKFKSRLGFDANNESVSNVKNPILKGDAVNLDHFDYYNSITTYQEDRGYNKNHITNFSGKLYLSTVDISSPAGEFDFKKWTSIKTSPFWVKVDSRITKTYNLTSGEYISTDTSGGNLILNLPDMAHEGESITILDTGRDLGYNKIDIKSKLNNIKYYDIYEALDQGETEQKLSVNNITLTTPGTMLILSYISGLWEIFEYHSEELLDVTVTNLKPNEDFIKAQAWNKITDISNRENIRVMLPTYASNGDKIYFTNTELRNTSVTFFFKDEDISFISKDKLPEITLPTYNNIILTYVASKNYWDFSFTSKENIVKNITDDYTAILNEEIKVVNDSAVDKNITITLPNWFNVESTYKISFSTSDKVSVTLKCPSGKKLKLNKKHFEMMTYTEATKLPSLYETLDEYTFNPVNTRVESISLFTNGSNWEIYDVNQQHYITDPKYIDEPGVIKLVSETEMTANNMTSDNRAITPFLLEKRHSTETRKGIIELSTQEETLAGVNDLTAVTPKKLLNTISSENQRGLAFVASQVEVNTGTDHTKFVTPKTLDMKLPNDAGKKGVVSLVKSTGKAPTTRGVAGTDSYNFNDGVLVLTPKSIYTLKATENISGLAMMATQTEVNSGVTTSTEPLFVTPATLHARTATETRAGILELATQAETLAGTNDLTAVTPKKLLNTISSEKQRGLAFIARQDEVDIGSNRSKFVSPKTLDMKLPNDAGKKGVVSLVKYDGVEPTKRGELGTNIFDYNDGTLVVTPKSLAGLKASETVAGLSMVATQGEVNNGKSTFTDKMFVTPETLHARTATTSRTGIAKLTTNATVLVKSNDTDIVTPSTLHSVQGTASLKGLVRYSTGAEVTAKHSDSVITPLTLSTKMTSVGFKTNTSNLNITGNTWDGFNLIYTTKYDTPIEFIDTVPTDKNGYIYKMLTNKDALLKTLEVPPSNKFGSDVIVDGKITHVVKEGQDPKYDGVYLYECFNNGIEKFEKLTVGYNLYHRNSVYNTISEKFETSGWSSIYNSMAKPTPLELNTYDKDDVMIGEIQVNKYLDIIVDENNRLRIMPNKLTKEKVSYLWLNGDDDTWKETP